MVVVRVAGRASRIAVALVLLVSVTSGAEPTMITITPPVDGEVTPDAESAAVGFTGLLVPMPGPVVAHGSLDHDHVGALVLESNGVITIVEQRWQTLDPKALDPTSPQDLSKELEPWPGVKVSDMRLADEYTVRVASVQLDAEWLARSEPERIKGTPAQVNGTCELRVDESQRVGLGESSFAARTPAEHGESTVSATCRAQFSIDASQSWIGIQGAALVVRYVDSFTDKVRHETFHTGLEIEQDEENPAILHHVQRYVRFHPQRSPGGPGDFTVESQADIHAQQMLATGELRIPTSRGIIEWGELRQEGEVSEHTMIGTFQLNGTNSPDAQPALQITGDTINEPPLPHDSDLPDATWIVAGAAAAAALLWRRRWLAILALFTRYTKSSVLEHPRRQRLLDIITSSPGIGLQELCQMTGYSRGNVRHHLEMLVNQELVSAAAVNNRYAYQVVGAGPAKRMDLCAQGYLKQIEGTWVEQLVEHLKCNPSASQRELADFLGVTRSAVTKRLQKLQEVGVVERVENSCSYRVRAPH